MSRKAIAVIPARYGSTRFPAKVIAELCGKPIIQWVHEKAKASKASAVYVATDHEKVAEVVKGFGGDVIMTRDDHPSGTDRIHEAVSDLEGDVIINVQGDEPLIPTCVIDQLIDIMLADDSLEMGTVAVLASREEIESNPNIVKVVFDNNNLALYFSRTMIPFKRDDFETDAYRHWGIYAYRRDILERFVTLPEGRLEQCEKLEQLRALENGIKIFVHLSNLESIGIDTPGDLELVEQRIKEMA